MTLHWIYIKLHKVIVWKVVFIKNFVLFLTHDIGNPITCFFSSSENKVHHLVLTVWRADEVAEKPPHLETIQSGEVYKHLIERFTSADDLILVYGPLVGEFLSSIP